MARKTEGALTAFGNFLAGVDRHIVFSADRDGSFVRVCFCVCVFECVDDGVVAFVLLSVVVLDAFVEGWLVCGCSGHIGGWWGLWRGRFVTR